MRTLKFYKRVKAPSAYPGKTYNNGNCLLHHLVWWQNTGELVPKGFVLHHKNEDKFDNRFENLELLSNREHSSHRIEHKRLDSLKFVCPACNEEFSVRPNYARARLARSTTGHLFCSRACGTYYAYPQNRGVYRNKDELTHGSPTAYITKGCRCSVCKEGHRLRSQQYRDRKRGGVV